jgi:hypothetical protein|tara:strand:- start:324 stop:713 length:390 start_codon:yes stop_codon:yes gene_type:complete
VARPTGTRDPDHSILKRQQRLYRRQSEGLTTRQLVIDHSLKEGLSERHAWEDWKQVKVWNEEDWAKDRESMVSRIQSMRLRAIDKAMKKGQLQTVQTLLADLGKVVGESEEVINIKAPELNIRVENKKS